MVNLEGLEMIAVLATVVLFGKVLGRFGWLADDYGGKRSQLVAEVSAA